ncbi:MAG: hypothetical protein GY870_01475 [archaeon]|nr:hypothetical protein [archaeon]
MSENKKSEKIKKKKISQKTENAAIVSGIFVLGITLIVDSLDFWVIKIIIGIVLIIVSYLLMQNYFKLVRKRRIT